MNQFFEGMLEHARRDSPNEACGLVVARGNKVRLVPGRNLAEDPKFDFDLDPQAWLEVRDDEEVVGMYHSHTNGGPEPSMADRSSCELHGVPWHIVTPEGGYMRIEPSGFRAPYRGRPYVYGVHDCFSLIRDWYEWEWGVLMPNYTRQPEFWKKGESLYEDHYAECGFRLVEDGSVERGDLFFIQYRSDVPNHSAIYMGDGSILHHVGGRLSSIDPWSGYWVSHMTHHLRHNTRMGSTAHG